MVVRKPRRERVMDWEEGFRWLRVLLGFVVLYGLAWVLSEDRRRVSWRVVVWGIVLQFGLAGLVLFMPGVQHVFSVVAQFFVKVFEFAREGAEFLFGALVAETDRFGFIFAFQALPTIVFFSALSALLFYLGVLPWVIRQFARLMQWTMRISGREALASAANVFVGQTEAPLLIRPYLDQLTRSELFCLMVSGMSTIAGSVLAAYVGFLGGDDPAQQLFFARHLLSASVISAPAAVVMAKLMIPEREEVFRGSAKSESVRSVEAVRMGRNLLEALARGTHDGIRLAVNVAGMLIAFIALVAMVNYLLEEGPGRWFHLNDLVTRWTQNQYTAFNFQSVMGFCMMPVAWLLGVPTSDLLLVGQLIGEKTILNEFYAYVSLARMREMGLLTDPYSVLVAVYALCGFSNIASIGIQIGGIGALVPERRYELAQMGWYALIASTLACLSTACVVSLLAPWLVP